MGPAAPLSVLAKTVVMMAAVVSVAPVAPLVMLVCVLKREALLAPSHQRLTMAELLQLELGLELELEPRPVAFRHLVPLAQFPVRLQPR